MVTFVVRAFAVQVQVELSHDRREAIGVFLFLGEALVGFQAQAVGCWCGFGFEAEKTFRVQLGHG